MHLDVNARRRAEATHERIPSSERPSGGDPRAEFLQQIETAGQRLQARGEPFAVFVLDLDRFKHVNDSLGREAGDALLKKAIKRLTSSLRAADVPVHLGGDEFALIQTAPRAFGPTDDMAQVMRESAIVLANRIIELIGRPFDLDRHRVVVGASIGIATAPNDGLEPAWLMERAGLALSRAKADGGNAFAFFRSELAEAADLRRRLENDFHPALERREFELHYQPLVDMASREVCGVEALVRWHHPSEGLVMPDRFIPFAEESGLITSLGEWVVRAACAQAVKWPSHIRLAVNVSPAQFAQPNLFDLVMCALVDSGLPPERLEIEITEQVLLKDEAAHIAALHQLKNIGISIALDDFGTGYSSLSYLKMFPFDKIKIDRSFTREILDRSVSAAIVCAVANLGRALDIISVAEGVETEEQAQALRLAGVTQAQGFLFGRPLPAGQIRFTTRDDSSPAAIGRPV